MATIPNSIDGVVIEFGSDVVRDVSNEMLAAMTHAIVATVSGKTIEKLFISSAKDDHKCPSRHVTGNAVDISRINGLKIGVHYSSDPIIASIVDGLQTRFESAPKRRENFGPTIKKKSGKDFAIDDHDDHFHWSVDGDHSACRFKLLQRFESWWDGNTQLDPRRSEICDI